MLITIAAIGRLKAGEERVLFDRFFERAGTAGRKLGLTFTVREFPESRASSAETRKTEEAATVIAALGQRGTFVTLDEQGKDLTSPAFANRIARWRDGGSSDVWDSMRAASSTRFSTRTVLEQNRGSLFHSE